MNTLSVRVSEDEYELIREYARDHNISVSLLLKTAVLDLIEDSMEIDEKRILQAWKRSKKGKAYSHEEVIEMLCL